MSELMQALPLIVIVILILFASGIFGGMLWLQAKVIDVLAALCHLQISGATASQPAPPPGVVPVPMPPAVQPPIPPPVPVPSQPLPIPPPKPAPAPPVVVPAPPVIPAPVPVPPIPAKPTGPVGLSRQNWPHDPAELDAFYGDPRGAGGGPNPAWEAANLVSFTFPWHEKGAQSYKIHKKCLASLDRILNAIWDHAGHDQAKITAAHLDETGGTYAFRANRNNPAVLSNHSRGIAIDLAPDSNPNRKAWVEDGTMLPRWVIQIFKAEGWRWGGDFNSTKDAMHFEAVFDQHHDQPPVPAPVVGSGPVVPATAAPVSPSVARFTGIIATVFGGKADPNHSAYDNHMIDDDEFGVALPFHFPAPVPKVRVFAGGKSVVAVLVDVGPWNTKDPYWQTGTRPQAETGTDMTGRKTNHAGIDLTPATAKALGIDGKGVVDWEFA